jgi:hypothetical protein
MSEVVTIELFSLELAAHLAVLNLSIGEGHVHLLFGSELKSVVDGDLKPDLGSELGAALISASEFEGKDGLLDAFEGLEGHLEVLDGDVAAVVVADEGGGSVGGLLSGIGSGGRDGGGDVRHRSQSRNDKFGLHEK